MKKTDKIMIFNKMLPLIETSSTGKMSKLIPLRESLLTSLTMDIRSERILILSPLKLGS